MTASSFIVAAAACEVGAHTMCRRSHDIHRRTHTQRWAKPAHLRQGTEGVAEAYQRRTIEPPRLSPLCLQCCKLGLYHRSALPPPRPAIAPTYHSVSELAAIGAAWIQRGCRMRSWVGVGVGKSLKRGGVGPGHTAGPRATTAPCAVTWPESPAPRGGCELQAWPGSKVPKFMGSGVSTSRSQRLAKSARVASVTSSS